MYPEKFMASAMELAKIAYKENEVPVGAIVVKSGMVIGRGFNQVITTNSVSSHAEIIAINNASQTINNYRLKECDIYVTLEPCHMCAKAIVDARIQNLYFATFSARFRIFWKMKCKKMQKFFWYDHSNACRKCPKVLVHNTPM